MPCNHCGGRDYDARQSAARTSGIFCAWRGHALLLSADRPRSTGADEYDGRSIPARTAPGTSFPMTDRKSTRLNSSHLVISYAVFCLKKKNTQPHSTIVQLNTLRKSTHPHHTKL